MRQVPLFLLILIQHASYLDSTSNHNILGVPFRPRLVASYLDSTSNHNEFCVNLIFEEVASYLDSTSNHNFNYCIRFSFLLLHILILHQTTTVSAYASVMRGLLHILILHQTTTLLQRNVNNKLLLHILILHQTTTAEDLEFKRN